MASNKLSGTKSVAHREWRAEQIRAERIALAKKMASEGSDAATILKFTGLDIAKING